MPEFVIPEDVLTNLNLPDDVTELKNLVVLQTALGLELRELVMQYNSGLNIWAFPVLTQLINKY